MQEDARSPTTPRRGITAYAPYTLWFVAAYFSIRVVSRMLISPSLEADEAEQMILCQTVAWGYGGQPPLYTWLQLGAFAIFGKGILALTLLKSVLLALTIGLTFVVVRRIADDALTGALACMGLFLIPQFAWEAQRDLSHSVLVVFAAALTTGALWRVVERGRTLDFCLLGATWAVGLLSKHNFVLVGASLLVAAATLPEFRAKVFQRRLLLAVVVAAVLVAPAAHWALTNVDEALSKVEKFNIGEREGSGLPGLLGAIATLMAIPAVLYLVVGLRSPAPRTPMPARQKAWLRLLVRSMAIGLVASAVLIVATGVTSVRQRWLLPVLYLAPIALALGVRPRLNLAGARIVLATPCVLAIVVLIGLPARTVIGPQFGSPCRLNLPYRALSEKLRGAGFEGGLIASTDSRVAGNLLLCFSGSTAHVTGYPYPPVAPGASRLYVWNPAEGAEFGPPADTPDGDRRAVTAHHIHRREDTETLEFVLIP